MNRSSVLVLLLLLAAAVPVTAVDWNTVKHSPDIYYYGEGYGSTMDEADKSAMEALLSSIATYVKSDFEKIYVDKTTNDGNEFEEVVRHCLQTYSVATLPNIKTFPAKYDKNGICTVMKYIPCAELYAIYEGRTKRLKSMVKIAEKAQDRGDIKSALQYYYWAYMLLRSLQYPNAVTDDKGMLMVDALPMAIKSILDNIKVEFVSRDGDEVNLFFTYKGEPATVDFLYYDGQQTDCEGNAEGGNGYLQMAKGHAWQEAYHISIEYEFKSWARDSEMESVLDVIPKAFFVKEKIVNAPKPGPDNKLSLVSVPDVKVEVAKTSESTSLCADMPQYATVMDVVVRALATCQYDKVMDCFTGRGLDNYLKLVSQRCGKLKGQPNPRLYVNACGNVVARGVQLGFTVTEMGNKTTLVDDVIFTFDENHKISNLTFGIGPAEESLLSKEMPWSDEVRQQVLDFLENYKTAYCLKDTAYIRAVFAENATIIVGHVAKVTTYPGIEDSVMSQIGHDIISYNRYTKDEYLAKLKKTFRQNRFINIDFFDNDIQYLEKKNMFGIQLGQQYKSSLYSDFGYLFLLVDMTNPSEPQIRIRTWQPKPDDQFGVYTAGNFYAE